MSLENPVVVVFGIFFLIMVVMIAKSVVVIPENHRGAIVRLGRYLKTLSPGFHVSVPLIDLVTRVDLDASIPGWQGLSERELEAAVESFVILGTVAGAKSRANRPETSSRASSSGSEAQALAVWLVKTASHEIGVNLSNDPMAKGRLAERAQGAVEELRSSDSCEINLPFITADASGPKHFSFSLTRSKLDEILGSGRS